MAGIMAMPMGRIAPDPNRKKLHFRDFLSYTKLPPLPKSADYTKKVAKFPMMLNDRFGDCVIAGQAHLAQVFTALGAGSEHIVPDSKIQQIYFAQTGGRDSGLNEDESLKHWQAYGLDGVKIAAYASIEPGDITAQRYATAIFGGCYYGVQLPNNYVDVLNNKAQDWSDLFYPPNPGLGHCIVDASFDENGVDMITWGRKVRTTDAWKKKYATECYVIISMDWISKAYTPSGVDIPSLLDAFKELTGQSAPDVPVPQPTPFKWEDVI